MTTPAPDLPELARLVARLRRMSAREWARQDRASSARRLVADLAAISAPGRPLPSVSDHALGDVLAVVGRDAVEVTAETGRLEDVRRLLADGLAATR